MSEGMERVAAAALAPLRAHGFELAGVYLLLGGQLRCIAQYGYAQVYDAIPPGVGLVGATIATGQPQITMDVTTSPGYLDTRADVRAEVCLPLRYEGQVVGALNVEHTTEILEIDLEVIHVAARAAERCIRMVGGLPRATGWQLLAHQAQTIAVCTDVDELAQLAVRQACALTGMDSALLCWSGPKSEQRFSAGPSGARLAALEDSVLAEIRHHTAGRVSLRATDRDGVRHQIRALGGFDSWAAVPLRTGSSDLLIVTGPPMGRVHTGTGRQAMSVQTMQVLEVLASLVGSALFAVVSVQEMQAQAERDPLTGLQNSKAFHEQFHSLSSTAGCGVAVLLADLDGFKEVNDTSGHLAGDQLLIQVAQALESAIEPAEGTLYRIGGDEFAAVVQLADASTAEEVAMRMRVRGRTVRTSVSIGLTERRSRDLGQTTAAEMLAEADLAMYAAKRTGRDRVERFEPTMSAVVKERTRLASDLADAIADDQLSLVYQPIVDLDRNLVLGGECLMRWTHPLQGAIPPAVFIPIAEETGLIHQMGRWAITAAMTQASAWNRQGRYHKIAINVSGLQLRAELAQQVRDELARTGLPADMVVLEITESAVADDPARVEVLQALHDLGVVIAIDDFGTGYSSLAYLRRLPIDIVKIDRSFTEELDNPRSQAVTKAVVDLAEALELSCVVEGVETVRQVEQIKSMGCTIAQGYLFSPPLPPEEFVEFVAAFQAQVTGDIHI